jgi:hypothetical protein
LRPDFRFTEGNQRKASEGGAQKRRVQSSAPCRPRHHDKVNSNKIIYLDGQFPHRQKPAERKKVLNGVKTFMVNEPLKTALSRRLARAIVLIRRPGKAPLPGTSHGKPTTADDRIIRHTKR